MNLKSLTNKNRVGVLVHLWKLLGFTCSAVCVHSVLGIGALSAVVMKYSNLFVSIGSMFAFGPPSFN